MKIDNIEIRNEALQLAEEALADIEYSRIPLSNIALKASRLARLVSEFDLEKIFEYEVSGYPSSKNGVSADVFRLGKIAERNSFDDKNQEVISCYSISYIEANIQSQRIALEQAHDRNISISSANPNQLITIPPSNISVQKKGKIIKLGEDNFINRLVLYIEENSTQKTFNKITNSNLEYVGNRLESIIEETCKGTHSSVEKEEAERCFMHTYMLIGDILEIERQRPKEKS